MILIVIISKIGDAIVYRTIKNFGHSKITIDTLIRNSYETTENIKELIFLMWYMLEDRIDIRVFFEIQTF